MSYIQRRGDTLFFRIAVPEDLRQHLAAREITRTLRTARKTQAAPLALEYAASAKRLFIEIRAAMGNGAKLLDLIERRKQKFRHDEQVDQHQDELDERDRRHHEELGRVRLEVEVETWRRVMAGFQPQSLSIPAAIQEKPPVTPASGPVHTFHEVIDGFLDAYDKAKNPSMFAKHKALLNMLREFTGNIPNTSVLQSHINDFFDALLKLPPDWKQQCRKQKVTIRRLAEGDHPKKLSPETFKMHKGRVREFPQYAVLRWQDYGFPTSLTVAGLKYRGDREKGEEGQRALEPAELKRMFEGPEMQSFASDPALAHQFWLPTIGLFTGARVNEICQLNPQADILKDLDTGIDYLLITVEGDTDTDITKTVKTGKTLKVPIHKKLIELGFLDYVDRVKATGAKRIFPLWKPIARRASGNAQVWFDQFLRDTNIRDETPFAMITGMHCLRHTLATTGGEQKLLLDSITGHAQPGGKDISSVFLGYSGAALTAPLDEKAALLNQLDYGLTFFKPMPTTPTQSHQDQFVSGGATSPQFSMNEVLDGALRRSVE